MSEHHASLETGNADADPVRKRGKLTGRGIKRRVSFICRGKGDGMRATGHVAQHGKSAFGWGDSRPVLREEQTGPERMADRPVVARKPGNAGGAKGCACPAKMNQHLVYQRIDLDLFVKGVTTRGKFVERGDGHYRVLAEAAECVL
jgi:hypothetical protein